MDFIELNVKQREEKGKSASRQLRQAGLVPAVLYGGSGDTKMLQVKSREVNKQLQDGHRNAILKLVGLPNETTAIIKDIQKAKTRDSILHLDLLRVAMDTEIETVVAVELVGEAIGTKEGGVLQHSIRELRIKALPKDVPEKYELDISELEINSAIKVSDVKAIPGVEILDTEEDSVVSIVPPTELKEEEAVEEVEGEGAEEGEAGTQEEKEGASEENKSDQKDKSEG